MAGQIERLIQVCCGAGVLAAVSVVSPEAWLAIRSGAQEMLGREGAADWAAASATWVAVVVALGIAASDRRRARSAERRARAVIEQDTLKAAQVCVARLSATVGALDQICRQGDLEGFTLKMYRDNVALGVAQLNALPLQHLPTHRLVSPITNIALCGGTITTMLDVLERYDADAEAVPPAAFEDVRRRLEESEDRLTRAVIDAGMSW